MNRKLLLLCSLLLLPILAFLPPQKKYKKKQGTTQENKMYKEVGSALPPFRIVTTDGGVFTNDSIAQDEQLILMLFNPTCDHCGMVTDTLLRYSNEAQKSRLLLVAGDNMMEYLPDFIRTHQLERYPWVRMGIDSRNLIQKVFLYEPLPQVNIYDSTRTLIRIFTGLQPGSSYLPYLR